MSKVQEDEAAKVDWDGSGRGIQGNGFLPDRLPQRVVQEIGSVGFKEFVRVKVRQQVRITVVGIETVGIQAVGIEDRE